jgi:hypothetical protein
VRYFVAFLILLVAFLVSAPLMPMSGRMWGRLIVLGLLLYAAAQERCSWHWITCRPSP